MKYLLVSLATWFLLASPIRSQEVAPDFPTTAVPLLNVSPSPMQNAMGGTGVALVSDDAFNTFFNPAQLGFASRTMNVRQGTYLQKTNWAPQLISSTNINAFALQFGYNFSDKLNLPLSVGVGFSRHFVDWKPSASLPIQSNEFVNSISVGASMDWRVQVAAGFSLKRFSSSLPSFSPNDGNLDGNAMAVDFGVMAVAPILKQHRLTNRLTTSLDVSLGYSQSNIGEQISYNANPSISDPLPRTSRLGYGVNSSFEVEIGQTTLQAVSGAFTAEVSDILVTRVFDDGNINNRPRVKYQVWGDVNLWDNLVRGRAGRGGVAYQHGWRASLFETVTLMGGVFRQGELFFTPVSTTSGWTVQSNGLFKLLRPHFSKSFARFLLENIEVQYVRSSWNEGMYEDMRFESLNLSLVGIRF